MVPKVSVNIRTYNSAKTLDETLTSVKKQSYKNIEVLVSDGYSKDDSVEIAKKFGARVNFADKLGDARHQNYEKSRGEYILSLDSDQVLDPKVIAECIKLAEKKKLDAISISEKSLVDSKSTILEKLIAFDKWLIDKNQDDDIIFGTACPRFFRKEFMKKVKWPPELSIFDDTILYSELLKEGAKVGYLSRPSIYHHEVNSWIILIKKFFRYGKGYAKAFGHKPTETIGHSLPRRSYFSRHSFARPHYFLGLIVLYLVKAGSAGAGAISYLITKK